MRPTHLFMTGDTKNAVIIVAAGSGSRARSGAEDLPKQYRLIGGQPVLWHTLQAFALHPEIGRIVLVVAAGAETRAGEIVCALPGSPDVTIVPGGATRQASVLAGLAALEETPPECVLIHDGARPFVTAKTISDVLDPVDQDTAAIAAWPVSDTIKQGSEDGITGTVPRHDKWLAQTPQGFAFASILAAHRHAAPGSVTDDAMLAEEAGMRVSLIPSPRDNIKITTAEDFVLAEKLLGSASETRIGMGYDIHAFEDGEAVILCGITIPYKKKLKGHSDADAGLHALTDAILGALSEGDIGAHFPPSDPQWKDCPSDIFLRHAASLVARRGGTISNLDLTLICEAPKIGPHRKAMQKNIAEICSIEPGRVAVKATTHEKLGTLGRGEGIAAQAVASIRLPLEGSQ